MNDTCICYTNGHTEGNWDELIFTKTSGIVTGDAPVSLSMPLLQFQKSANVNWFISSDFDGKGICAEMCPAIAFEILYWTRAGQLLERLRFTFTPNGNRQIQVENFSE